MKNSFLMKFLMGFSMPFMALRLLRRERKLMILSIVPMLITIGVGILFFTVGMPWVGAMLGAILPEASGLLLGVVYWMGLIIGYLIAGILFLVAIVLVASLIALPFNSLLAEETLKNQNFLESPPFSMSHWIKLTLRMLRVGLLRTVVLLIVGAVLFVFSLIPVVQLVAAFFGFVILASDAMDYSLELKELGLRQRFRVLKEYFWEIAGFGCCFGLTSLVPFLNFLLLPIGIIAGALLTSKLRINALE